MTGSQHTWFRARTSQPPENALYCQLMDACINHPDRRTALFCGRCGDPICVDCQMITGVGSRCVACVSLSPSEHSSQAERAPVSPVTDEQIRSFLVGFALVVFVALLFAPVIATVGLSYCVAQIVGVRSERSRAPALISSALFSVGYWIAIAPPLLVAIGRGDDVPASAGWIAFAAAGGFTAFIWRPLVAAARTVVRAGRPFLAGATVGCAFVASAAAWLLAAALVMLSVA
jgi:hypothetical protein